jgi:hypothetical protein
MIQSRFFPILYALVLGILLPGCSSDSSSGSSDETHSSGIVASSSSNTRSSSSSYKGEAIIADHNGTVLSAIPAEWITGAKKNLVIAYGHTSHGSQLVDGLNGLETWKGSPYTILGSGDTEGLELRDTPFSGASDLGNPDFVSWVAATRNYLDEHTDANVVMWSWCGELSWATTADVGGYLDSMATLEKDYPQVQFVYFTGHLDGTGVNGTLNQNNESIRTYVKKYNKILYDFADIESYDPDGNYYLDLNANDNCDYDSGNWCTEWQDANPGKWYEVTAQHSQSLNGNLKAYASWYLFARLAGWDGE